MQMFNFTAWSQIVFQRVVIFYTPGNIEWEFPLFLIPAKNVVLSHFISFDNLK